MFHTLPAASWASKASSSSCKTPFWKSRSQTTTEGTPSISLVRSVTMKTTWWGNAVPVSSTTCPSKTIFVPGTSGVHWLVTSVGAVKRLGSNTSRPTLGADARLSSRLFGVAR